ncbi:glycosyltransferase family 39 protein [Thermomonas sp. HDW16]|uniref:ArnT family glycosyltransferase n=1 Tax=Thermomonas sp. HDW16 TaxID=2714945 RepID=UPI00140B644C|nr:glycosyltransferase family 39 protein [Thermomonas sp. HDW16]QIL21000.1 glycosyltransferase family 39 protein [Thermomonas sp. HDW16]
MRGMQEADVGKRWFIGVWLILLVFKVGLASQLPLFVDEAFYWQEGRHLAWAYSDLPGLTAWLARIGDELGDGALALRLPFLAIAAAIPWLVARMTAREFDAKTGWQAGTLALLLPLAGTLGLLALPDVPLLLATALCLDGGLRLLRGVDAFSAGELAFGLVMGSLTHYRFAAVIAVGFVALLMLREGRAALRDKRVWAAVLVGALAWLPLLLWNLHNADAGLRFQLVDRHPWSFSGEGIRLGRMQLLLATPLLLAAMTVAAWRGVRDAKPATRYLALSGAMIVLGFLALGFFSDRERVSFHWPLPGYLALLPLVPAVLSRWSRGWRFATWGTAALGLAAVLGYYIAAATPSLRAQTAAQNFHPTNFAGWNELDAAVRERLAAMPTGSTILAGNFKIGAELGFARDDADIAVLDHPLNEKHGRAPQLALWKLSHSTRASLGDGPVLLVASANDVDFRDQLAHYHALCAQVGPLPPPQVLNVDHGRQRFLLFTFDGPMRDGACTTPALAFIDTPTPSAVVTGAFDIAGWAFKDGVGLRAVDVLLDGRVVAQARYGEANTGVADFWKLSTDPNHPNVYFRARVEGASPGEHWLGLRLRGADGSVEDWPEQKIEVR